MKLGEQVTGSHFIKSSAGQSGGEEDPNLPTDTVAVVLYDRGTKWLAVYPKATKTAYHNAPELITSARACKWNHATATPGMPRGNVFLNDRL